MKYVFWKVFCLPLEVRHLSGELITCFYINLPPNSQNNIYFCYVIETDLIFEQRNTSWIMDDDHKCVTCCRLTKILSSVCTLRRWIEIICYKTYFRFYLNQTKAIRIILIYFVFWCEAHIAYWTWRTYLKLIDSEAIELNRYWKFRPVN